MPITFDQHLLPHFWQQILKKQTNITQSTNFKAYSLYRAEVIGLQKPSKMNAATYEWKNGTFSLDEQTMKELSWDIFILITYKQDMYL